MTKEQTSQPKESFEVRINRQIAEAEAEAESLRLAFEAALRKVFNLRDQKNNPPWGGFSSAIVCGYLDRAKEILKERPDVIQQMNDEGIPVIAQPACDGNEKIFDLLLAHGADVNTSNDRGMTPLYFAASRDRVEIFKKLLLAGARLDAVTTAGDTIQSIAKEMGSTKVLAVLDDKDFMASVTARTAMPVPAPKRKLS